MAATKTQADVLVRVKECNLCHQFVRVVADIGRGIETAYDEPSGEVHECWDIPEVRELLVLADDDDVDSETGCCC